MDMTPKVIAGYFGRIFFFFTSLVEFVNCLSTENLKGIQINIQNELERYVFIYMDS
jgi:hypothetical protein